MHRTDVPFGSQDSDERLTRALFGLGTPLAMDAGMELMWQSARRAVRRLRRRPCGSWHGARAFYGRLVPRNSAMYRGFRGRILRRLRRYAAIEQGACDVAAPFLNRVRAGLGSTEIIF